MPTVAYRYLPLSTVTGLLALQIVDRLGYGRGGAEEIIAHRWYKGFDWDGLANCVLPPPWIPTLRAADDTKYFDEESRQECLQAIRSEAAQEPLPASDLEEWDHIWRAFGGC